jgi:DNA-binding transcriptional MerR regulator
MSAPDTRPPVTFTPREAAERTGLTLDALRYYEREGLVGPVDRTVGGRRRYTENDIAWVALLTCLRDAGLGIADLRSFTTMLRTDEAEATERVEFLRQCRTGLLEQVAATNRALEILDDKIAFYAADRPAAPPESRRDDSGPRVPR